MRSQSHISILCFFFLFNESTKSSLIFTFFFFFNYMLGIICGSTLYYYRQIFSPFCGTNIKNDNVHIGFMQFHFFFFINFIIIKRLPSNVMCTLFYYILHKFYFFSGILFVGVHRNIQYAMQNRHVNNKFDPVENHF